MRVIFDPQAQAEFDDVCRYYNQQKTGLGACRTWGVESENRPQRGQFLPNLQAHSPAMGQKDGEKWTAAVDLQPTSPKSDRLLGDDFTEMVRQGLRRVLAQPESCTVEFDDVRRRVLKRFPYKLLYSVETDHLYVIAVAHQHRKPGYWHDRIENS